MELIEKKGVKVFYVGTQGRFDQYGTPFIRKVWRRFPDDTQFLWRNRWMLSKVDYVITYIEHSWGGAASFADLARRKGKIVYNLQKPGAVAE